MQPFGLFPIKKAAKTPLPSSLDGSIPTFTLSKESSSPENDDFFVEEKEPENAFLSYAKRHDLRAGKFRKR